MVTLTLKFPDAVLIKSRLTSFPILQMGCLFLCQLPEPLFFFLSMTYAYHQMSLWPSVKTSLLLGDAAAIKVQSSALRVMQMLKKEVLRKSLRPVHAFLNLSKITSHSKYSAQVFSLRRERSGRGTEK